MARNTTNTEIYVQGQNEIDIEYWLSVLNQNPCIPWPMNYWYDIIEITFDDNLIQTMSDWYNIDLCESFTSTSR